MIKYVTRTRQNTIVLFNLLCDEYLILHAEFCILNHIENNSLHVTHLLLAHVYPGFCSDKHPTVAMVPAEVWEEDGSLLWYHSEYTVFIWFARVAFNTDCYALMCVPSCG